MSTWLFAGYIGHCDCVGVGVGVGVDIAADHSSKGRCH
jgi:hypothetical protein